MPIKNTGIYHVAISFAEADTAAASVAAELAMRLSRRGLRVFYFRSIHEAATTLGEKLDETLTDVYAARSLVVVAIGSEHYCQTHYTKLEFSAAQSRPRDAEQRARIIPLSADGHAVPGLAADTHYLNLATAVDHLCQRCGRSPESYVRRRVAWILCALSATFLAAILATDGDPETGMGAAVSLAVIAGGPMWSIAFVAVPYIYMVSRRRSARHDLMVLSEGLRLVKYRRIGGIVSWAFFTVFCVAVATFLFDFGLWRSIAGDLRAQRFERARDRWLGWNASLLYHRSASQSEINREIASQVRASPSFEDALRRMVDWRRDPVRLEATFEFVRDEMALRGRPLLTEAGFAPPGVPAAPWWHAAWEIGLWPPEAKEWSAFVGRVAARQLLLSLADTDSDPFTWSEGRLRDFEKNSLTVYAAGIIARFGHDKWGGPRHRLALIALTQDWAALEKWAAEKVRGSDPNFDLPVVLAFLRHAPLERVRRWLAANLGLSTQGWMLNAVGEAVEARDDPDSMFVLLELADSARIAPDPFNPLGRSLTLPISARATSLSVERIRNWLKTESPPRASVLRCLLRSASRFERFDPAERKALLEKLVVLLNRAYSAANDSDPYLAYRAIAPPAYELIAKVGFAAGTDYLRTELVETAKHRYGGSEQREALLRAFRSSRPDDLGIRALEFAKATRADAVQSRYDDSAVQGEYLLAFASDPKDPENHREFVASLLDLYASAATKPSADRPFHLARAREGFVALFSRLDDAELISLFRQRRASSDILEDGVRSSFFLSITKDAKRKLPEAIEADILVDLAQRRAPDGARDGDPLIRQIMESNGYPNPWKDIPGLLAACGGMKSLTFFQSRVREGKEDLTLLAQMGDAESLNRAIREVGPGTASRDLEKLGNAIRLLPDAARLIALRLCVANRAVPASRILSATEGLRPETCREVICRCLERGDVSAPLLLKIARQAEVTDERLVKLARSEFMRTSDLHAVTSALSFLRVAAPSDCAEMLGDAPAVDRVATLLRTADHVRWINFIEGVEWPSDVRTSFALGQLAAARPGLFVLDERQVPGNEWASRDIFPANGMIIKNPLLAALCRTGREEDGWATLRATSKREDQPPILIGGNLVDPGTTYRAYGLWLAASTFHERPVPVAELVGKMLILNDLFSGNDTSARAAASICLAVCPAEGDSAGKLQQSLIAERQHESSSRWQVGPGP